MPDLPEDDLPPLDMSALTLSDGFVALHEGYTCMIAAGFTQAEALLYLALTTNQEAILSFINKEL